MVEPSGRTLVPAEQLVSPTRARRLREYTRCIVVEVVGWAERDDVIGIAVADEESCAADVESAVSANVLRVARMSTHDDSSYAYAYAIGQL